MSAQRITVDAGTYASTQEENTNAHVAPVSNFYLTEKLAAVTDCLASIVTWSPSGGIPRKIQLLEVVAG